MNSKIRLHMPSPINSGRYHGALKEESSQSESTVIAGKEIYLSVSISKSVSVGRWIGR